MQAASPASSASTTFAINSIGGFNSRVDLSCVLPGALASASCRLDPQSVSGPGKATVTVSTNPMIARAQRTPGGHAENYAWTRWGTTSLVGLFAIIWFPLSTKPNRTVSLLIAMCCVLVLLTSTSCGGAKMASSPANTVSSLPRGNYTITVVGVSGTGDAQLKKTLDLSLSVR